MKISNEPTPYLLLKAGTDSAWDCCDFAIVYLSKEWRQTQSGACRIHQGCDKEPAERTGFIDQKVFHELHYATSESSTPTWRVSASS